MTSRPRNSWRELAAVGLLLMELPWIVLWYRSLTRAALPIPITQTMLVLAGFLFLAYLVGRLLIALRLKTSLQIGLMAGLVLICILVGQSLLISSGTAGSEIKDFAESPLQGWGQAIDLIPSQFMVVLAVLFTWWRGISLSKQRVGPSTVAQTFRNGIFLLILAAILLTRIVRSAPPLWLIVLFLVAALVALAAARSSISGSFRGGRISPFDRRWFGELFAAVFSVLGIAYIAAVVLVSQRERLAGWLEGLFYFLGVLVSTPVVLLVSLLARPLSSIPIRSELAPTPTPGLTEVVSQPGNPFQLDLTKPGSLDLMARFKFLLVWGSVILVVVLLALAIRQAVFTAQRFKAEREEDPEAFQGLGGFMRLFMESLLGEAKGIGEGIARRLSREGQLLAAARVRQIFHQFLDLCADLGQARPAAQTPYEFLPSAQELFPSLRPELNTITAAYVAVRYGQLPETESQVQEVERAWELIREQGETRKGRIRTSKRYERLAG